MTIATDIEDKIVVLNKLRDEIAELNEEKIRVVRDINVPAAEAREKARVIIEEAEKKANSIIANASKIKAESDATLATAKQTASDIVGMANGEKLRIAAEAEKIYSERQTFDAYRLSLENDLANRKIEYGTKLNEAINRGKEVAESEIKFSSRKATLDRQEESIKSREKACVDQEQDIQVRMESVIRQEKEIFEKAKVVDEESKKNESIVKEANKKHESSLVEKEINKKLLQELSAQKIQQTAEKNTINAQFAQIEKTNLDLEERAKALDEKLALITLKNREIDDKIKTLTELRKK